MKNTEFPISEDARNELIYSLLCECERLFSKWMNMHGFDLVDVKAFSFNKGRITFFGELIELISGEFKWSGRNILKIPTLIFASIVYKRYRNKKIVPISGIFKKRYKIQNYSRSSGDAILAYVEDNYFFIFKK